MKLILDCTSSISSYTNIHKYKHQFLSLYQSVWVFAQLLQLGYKGLVLHVGLSLITPPQLIHHVCHAEWVLHIFCGRGRKINDQVGGAGEGGDGVVKISGESI